MRLHCATANGVRFAKIQSVLAGSIKIDTNLALNIVKVDLKNLGIVKQEDNWNDLILPSGHKDMVQAMVESFTSTGSATGDVGNRDDYDVDLVPGKG